MPPNAGERPGSDPAPNDPPKLIFTDFSRFLDHLGPFFCGFCTISLVLGAIFGICCIDFTTLDATTSRPSITLARRNARQRLNPPPPLRGKGVIRQDCRICQTPKPQPGPHTLPGLASIDPLGLNLPTFFKFCLIFALFKNHQKSAFFQTPQKSTNFDPWAPLGSFLVAFLTLWVPKFHRIS
jgi:hypothetical protein